MPCLSTHMESVTCTGAPEVPRGAEVPFSIQPLESVVSCLPPSDNWSASKGDFGDTVPGNMTSIATDKAVNACWWSAQRPFRSKASVILGVWSNKRVLVPLSDRGCQLQRPISQELVFRMWSTQLWHIEALKEPLCIAIPTLKHASLIIERAMY